MNKRLFVSMPLRSLLCFVLRLIRRFPFAVLLASLFRASFASALLFGLHTSPFSPLFASPFAPLCALPFVYRQACLHWSRLAYLFGPVFAYSSVLLFMPSFAFLLLTLCRPLIAACVVAMARFWFAAFAALLPSRPAPPLLSLVA